MKKAMIFSLLVLLFSAGMAGRAQSRLIPDSLQRIADEARGTTGVYLMSVESGHESALNGNAQSLNGEAHFPMQSVFKFPLAMYILDQVDKGKLSLDQKVRIRKKDWAPTWSPMRDHYKGGDVELPLREVLGYTVSNSDNFGCDLLFGLAGGPGRVHAYIQGLGIKDISIAATEAEMARGWEVQYRNWSTPAAMAALLRIFYSGKALSAASTRLLMQLMTETTTGPMRIKGLLPSGVIVAIITLPDGRHLIIVVFVSDAKADEATREGVIARIARLAYDTMD